MNNKLYKNESGRSRSFIANDLKRIKSSSDGVYEFSVGIINDDIYTWEVIIIGPQDTPYESGIFKAEMIFPLNYPEAPPTFRFISKMWHPNIDSKGNVCISILHQSGDDEYGYEDLNERWLPVRTPESVIISIISLLNAPNCESPANIEAAQQYRDAIKDYNKTVRRLTERTLDDPI